MFGNQKVILFYPFLLLIEKYSIEDAFSFFFPHHVFLQLEKSKEKKLLLAQEIHDVVFYFIRSTFYCAPNRFINMISVTRGFNYKVKN